MQDHNTKLLDGIYENAELARDILGRLIKITDDANFRQTMAEQFAEYHRILDEAERLMLQLGRAPRPARSISRIPIYTSLSVNTRIDATSSHLAEMLMQGSLMGWIDMARNIREYTEAQEESISLARRLQATEDNNMQQMRSYI